MNPHDYCTGWRQVRVFLRDFDIKAFVEFPTAKVGTAAVPTHGYSELGELGGLYARFLLGFDPEWSRE
jgi:hypothetical protein